MSQTRARDEASPVIDRILRVLLPIALLTLGLVLWEIVVRVGDVPPYVLPSPWLVFSTLISDRAVLLPSLLVTLTTTLEGFLLAAVGGIGLAVLFNQSRVVEYSLYPYAVILQVTPIVAIAPLLLVYLPQQIAVLAWQARRRAPADAAVAAAYDAARARFGALFAIMLGFLVGTAVGNLGLRGDRRVGSPAPARHHARNLRLGERAAACAGLRGQPCRQRRCAAAKPNSPKASRVEDHSTAASGRSPGKGPNVVRTCSRCRVPSTASSSS